MPLVAWPHCSLPHAPPTPKGTPVRETENFASYQARTSKNVSGQVTIQFSKGSQSSLETTPTRPVAGNLWGVVSMQLLSPPNCQRALEPSPAVRPQRGGRGGPSSAEQVAPCFQGVTASEIASSWLSPTACGNFYFSGLADCVNPSAEKFPSWLLVWR